MAKGRFVVEGPRWAGLGSAIRETAFSLGLELDLARETHFIRETVFATVRGSDEKVLHFSKWLESIQT